MRHPRARRSVPGTECGGKRRRGDTAGDDQTIIEYAAGQQRICAQPLLVGVGAAAAASVAALFATGERTL